MKTRFGFISNSSSSSYIVAIKFLKTSEKCPYCGRSDPNPQNFLEALERSNNYDNQVNAVGVDNIIKERFEYNYLEGSLGKFREILEKYNNDEFIIADIDISYHDEITKNIFNNMKASGDIIVIDDSDISYEN